MNLLADFFNELLKALVHRHHFEPWGPHNWQPFLEQRYCPVCDEYEERGESHGCFFHVDTRGKRRYCKAPRDYVRLEGVSSNIKLDASTQKQLLLLSRCPPNRKHLS